MLYMILYLCFVILIIRIISKEKKYMFFVPSTKIHFLILPHFTWWKITQNMYLLCTEVFEAFHFNTALNFPYTTYP